MGAVYLVRHGQASFGEDDYDVLSPLGERQAAAAGEELRRRGVTPTLAVAGTLSRQRATAEIALAACAPGLVAGEDARWNEYDHVDLVGGHGTPVVQDRANPRAFQTALESAIAAWLEAGEDSRAAESWPAFLGRVRGALDDVVAALGKGEQAVVFSSGGVLATLAGMLTGAPEAGMRTLHRVTINAGLTKVVTGTAGVTLLSFNEHAHLEGTGEQLLTYR